METEAGKERIHWTFTTPLVAHQKGTLGDKKRYSYYLPVPPHIVGHLGLADENGKPNSLVKWSIDAWLITFPAAKGKGSRPKPE
jgi:hypothetical protein